MISLFKSKSFLLASALLLLSASAQASLIETDFKTVGDGLLFVDTVTGKEWIDVTHTTNLGGVTGLFSTSMFAGKGFQLATAANVTQLFTDAGAGTVLNGDHQNFTANNFAAAESLYNLMEHTSPFNDMASNPWIHGFIYSSATEVTIARIGDGSVMGRGATGSFDVGSNGLFALNNNVGGAVGVWAFRNAAPVSVPEPASLGLLGLGIAALGLARRRKIHA